MIKTGIIGDNGYTAGELIRLLIAHPDVEIIFIHSESHAGQPVTAVYSDLSGDTNLSFTDKPHVEDIDVLFCCTSLGNTRRFIEANHLPESLAIIDLSADFRIEAPDNDFIYGLPELNRKRIVHSQSRRIANPGSLATAVQLALLPLAKNLLLGNDIQISAITGSTEAEQKLPEMTYHSWRNDNISLYQPLFHQHLPEIKQNLTALQSSFSSAINIVAMQGCFSRGVFASVWMNCPDVNIEFIRQLYTDYYADHSFTHVVEESLHLKQVINTNKCLLHIDIIDRKILITSVIDNLLKGAAGQAVHNMNLLFGLKETTGLNLKPSAF